MSALLITVGKRFQAMKVKGKSSNPATTKEQNALFIQFDSSTCKDKLNGLSKAQFLETYACMCFK